MLRRLVQRLFRLLGKSDRRIIAVFASSRTAWRDAVAYVRAEAPQFPVWLLTTEGVAEARGCERIVPLGRGPGLLWRAAAALWPEWVVLSVVTYTRERGFGWMKLAPLAAPPWKLLVMNEQRDFFPWLPFGLAAHGLRRARDAAATAAETAKDFLLGVFWKVAWTALDPLLALTSEPWLHPQSPPELAEAAEAAEPYVLFREGRGPEDLAPLERLFERPDTFAAAYQPGRAEFQQDVVARAAFRQLQPGEAAAVLAPIGEVVLVDAAKLARLGGLPRARSRRCQWLLVYWKAARAGWRSYSVGGREARLPMIPDRAFPEAEFCFRLLTEKPRPASAAGSLDGLRGSIATHPAHTRPWRPAKPRILIVSPYLPFPLSHGGAVRIFNLSRHLSRDYDLLLLTFRERGDQVDYERLASCFSRVIVVDQDERRREDPTVPAPVAQFRTRAMAAALREAAAEHDPDIVQVEYTQLAGYREAVPATPAVLVEHDVTFSLFEQLPDRAEYRRWYEYESHWLRRYEAVVVMSAPEREKALAAGAPEDRTWIVPNGVDPERFQPTPEPPGPLDLLFVGSFRHLPNLLAFEHLRREVLPRLWQRRPGLRLRVVAGPEYQKYWSGAADARITVEGFVADVAPRYAAAGVVVVPLPVSAGTNVKVLEAMACGRAVVSTPVGCAGLDLREGEELLVASGAEAFAAAVDRLLDDAGLRRSLAEKARRAAVDRFSWERCAAAAGEVYAALRRRG